MILIPPHSLGPFKCSILRSWEALQFVIQDREAIDGGGLSAQHERAEADRQGAPAVNGLSWGGGKTASGPTPDTTRLRKPASLSRKSPEVFGSRPTVGLQR